MMVGSMPCCGLLPLVLEWMCLPVHCALFMIFSGQANYRNQRRIMVISYFVLWDGGILFRLSSVDRCGFTSTILMHCMHDFWNVLFSFFRTYCYYSDGLLLHLATGEWSGFIGSGLTFMLAFVSTLACFPKIG